MHEFSKEKVQVTSVCSAFVSFMDCWREAEVKSVHGPFHCLHGQQESYHQKMRPAATTDDMIVSVHGPIIVGAGPSGLAVAACLKEKGLPSLILERSDCIASLWQRRTYDRLRLHLPKQFCELPLMPFPPCFPTYPTKQQFVAYVEAYARRFDIRPAFNRTVESAEYDNGLGMWRVRAERRRRRRRRMSVGQEEEVVVVVENYVSRWLVVATGENAEAVVPEIDGMGVFKGPVVHTSEYRSGDVFGEKRVLVVGCGNSGMEVCLDLCNYNAHPTIVVRDGVHVLPRMMLGRSTFSLSMWLLRWFSIRTVDMLLLLVARLMLGDTARLGLHRPTLGPLKLKSVAGKTPVLDVGTLAKIKSGDIKVSPAIKNLSGHGAEFVDGRKEEFDAVILATGYRSNVPSWLKEEEFFSEKDGLPRKPFPNGWKGKHGLYAVGFTKFGILGASMDARRVANDIEQSCNNSEGEAKEPTPFSCPQKLPSQMDTRFNSLDPVRCVSGF